MRQEDIQFLQNLQAKLNAADNNQEMNDCQANPRFWVILESRLVPADEEHGGEPYILDGECAQPLTLEEFVDTIDYDMKRARDDDELLRSWDDTDKKSISSVLTFVKVQLGWHDTQVTYLGELDAIAENTFFLTKEAAEKHIQLNRHHYRNPRTYAMTAWRSPEFERFFNLFKQFDFTQLKND